VEVEEEPDDALHCLKRSTSGRQVAAAAAVVGVPTSAAAEGMPVAFTSATSTTDDLSQASEGSGQVAISPIVRFPSPEIDAPGVIHTPSG
jgi:hypothetical protein